MLLNRKLWMEIQSWHPEQLDLLMTLARIPAPSHQEQRRAEFCKDWLEQNGAEGVDVDEALRIGSPSMLPSKNPGYF